MLTPHTPVYFHKRGSEDLQNRLRLFELLKITVYIAAFGIAAFAADLKCLPSGISEDAVVRYAAARSAKGENRTAITVRETLKNIHARCVRGKLVDDRRREIRFYSMQGCWGNPPADYQEILQQQRIEIEKLRMRYMVIEMTCESGVDPRRIS